MNVSKLFGEAEGILAREAYNAFSESYNKNVSEMFSRLHSELEDTKGVHHTEYDERQYKRVAFHSRQQADAFFAYMQKYNIEAIAAPVKLNGQYLVEIPKQVKVDSIQNTTEEESEEDELLKLKEQKQNDGNTVVTASELLENYYNTTGEEADEPDGERQQQFYAERQSSLADELSGYIAGQMEGFGSVYFSVRRAVDTAVSFVGQTEDDFFQSEGTSTSLFDKNAEKKYNPHVNTSVGKMQYQKALVLNNDTVLVDGKVVTDAEIRNNVLAQHRSRMAKAEAYAGGHKLKNYSSVMRERMQHNAQAVQAQIYGQEYVVRSELKTEGFLYFGGAMTEITEKMNTASVVREMNREFSFQKTDADVLDRVKTGFHAGGRVMTAEQEKYLTYVTDAIRISSPASDTGTTTLSVYQREELDKVLSRAKYTVFAARGNEKRIYDRLKSGAGVSGDGLKSALASLSENEIKTLGKSMERFARTKNISSVANELSAVEKAVVLKFSTSPVSAFSETELKTLQSVMQKYESEHTISKAYRSSINEIRKNMNFNADELDMMEYISVRESMDKVVKYEKTVNPYKEFSVSDMYAYQFGENGYTEEELAQMGLTKEEVTQLRDFLENKESSMQYYNTLLAVEKDFGIKIDPSVPFSRERLLEVNKAFLKKAEAAEFTLTKPDGTKIADVGYQFVKADGSFDLEALQKLSALDLKAIGISEETRQMLLEVNNPEKWGFNSKKIAGKAFQGWQKLMSKIAKNNPEMQQVQQDFNMMYKFNKLRKTSKEAVKKGGKAAKLKIDAYKAKHAKYSGREVGNGAAKGTSVGDTSKKTLNAAKKRKVNSDRNDKYIARMEKKLKRVERSESFDHAKKELIMKSKNAVKAGLQKATTSNSVVVRKTANFALKAGSNAVKLANTAKAVQATVATISSSVMPVILGVVLFLIILAFVNSVFIVILSSVTNLFEADYTEKVAYVLYETLKDKEDEWVENLTETENRFKDRSEYLYDSAHFSYESYVGRLERLCLSDDKKKLFVNPFNPDFVSNETNSDLLTEIKGYDGKITAGISTNSSIYNRRREEENFNSGWSNIESGHTSNIKDILAMVDVMYQMNTGTMADEFMGDVLGLPKATVDWTNSANGIVTFFKWLSANTVKSWFSNNEDDPLTGLSLSEAWAENGTVSYQTIEGYVVNLFESSHQEEIHFEVNFYEVKNSEDIEVIRNGHTEKLAKKIKQTDASELEYCVEPVTNKFPVYWESNTPAPYITDTNGSIRSLTSANYANNGFAIPVSVEDNLVGDKKDLCLWSGMGNDEETYTKIKENLTDSGSGCWKQNEEQSKTEEKKETFKSEWKNSENEARAEVENKINNARNAVTAGETYELSNHNNKFKYVKVTKGTDFDISVESKLVRTVYHYWLTDDYGEWIEQYSSDSSEDWRYDGLFNTAEEIWEYKAKVTDVLISTTQTEEYERNCQKHNFQYCGGHINVHEQGVVFSATNEQIAMTGIAEPLPVAQYTRTEDGGTTEYDLRAAGYDTLRGKYIDVDYTTFSNAVNGDGNKAQSVSNDIQGSYITGQSHRGVNFLTDENNTDQWAVSKTSIASDTMGHFYRDIFDVDCALLKGKGIFPCREYTDFESWTTDNMQIALMKISADWAELYGFEAPLEIGDKWVKEEDDRTTSGYTLTSSDVKTVMELIKKQYGYSETNESQKERLEATELALSHVGRGHYSEVHTSHDFLSYTCNSTCSVNNALDTDGERNAADTVGEVDYNKMKGSCTAGDNSGFINYIYNTAHPAYNGSFDYRQKTESKTNSNGNAAYAAPADLLVRNYLESTEEKNAKGKDKVYLRVDIGNHDWRDESTIEILRKYKESEAVIYIGTFSEETLKEIGGDDYNESGKYLRLTGSQKIYADIPVTVDLTKIGSLGTVYLHTEKPEDMFDLSGETNYWWVMPENRINGWSNIYSYGFGT